MSWLDSIIGTFTDSLQTQYRQPAHKFWCEYEVDTYWTRHAIIPGTSIDDAAKRFRRTHPHVDLSCIAAYRGPKLPGETLDKSDEPFMEGYKTNLGKIHYYNGATKR